MSRFITYLNEKDKKSSELIEKIKEEKKRYNRSVF